MHDAFRHTPNCPRCGTAAHFFSAIYTIRTHERAIRKLRIAKTVATIKKEERNR